MTTQSKETIMAEPRVEDYDSESDEEESDDELETDEDSEEEDDDDEAPGYASTSFRIHSAGAYQDDDDDDDEEEEDSDEEEEEEEEGYGEGAMVAYDGEESEEDDEGFQDEPLVMETTETVYEERVTKDRGATFWWWLLICCCCCLCILLALGIILGLWVFKETDDELSPTVSPMPTVNLPPAAIAPAYLPTDGDTTAPTPTDGGGGGANNNPDDEEDETQPPTVNIPPIVILPPVADSYIRNGNGENQVNFGDDEGLVLVNDGGDSSNILLSFDMTEINQALDQGEAIPRMLLRLEHEPHPDGDPMTMQVSQVPGSDDLDIESLTWDSFERPTDVVPGPQLEVAPIQTTIDIDITELVVQRRRNLKKKEERAAAVKGGTMLRKRDTDSAVARLEREEYDEMIQRHVQGARQLQSMQDNRLVLLIESVGNAPFPGEQFYSREYNDGEYTPELLVFFATPNPTANPTITGKPTTSPAPSIPPTLTFSPTTSPAPSASPTRSPQPTLLPSVFPTISPAPTTCLEQSRPKLVNLFGTGTPVAATDVIETIAQKGTTVKIAVNQLWTQEGDSADWIIPYYSVLDGTNATSCERTKNVPYGDRLTFELPCYPFPDEAAFVAIIVNDASFEKGNDFQLPPGCVADGSDHTGKKSTYMLHIPCISSCDLSAAPSTAP